MKVKSAVIGSYLTGDKYKISQKCKVTPDPDDMNGWLRVIKMKRLKPKQILPCDSTTYMWQRKHNMTDFGKGSGIIRNAR